MSKTQWVRLVDVFALGPFMVWAGVELARTNRRHAGAWMAVFGVATIVYNGRNYLVNK